MTDMLNNRVFEAVRAGVVDCLGGDNSGHGMDHIDRVETMTVRFCMHFKGKVDCNVARLVALLHDVDDYKLIGRHKADKLENTTAILECAGVDPATRHAVKEAVATIGYGKALAGIRPDTLEGMIVSDADMCDSSGVTGMVRALQYAVSSRGSGVVFDPHTWPDVTIGADKYNATGNTHDGDSFINYFFEKMFRLKGMMLTEPGRQEAAVRDEALVHLLRHYFREQSAPEWSDFLENYLRKR